MTPIGVSGQAKPVPVSVRGGSAFWPASYRCFGETTISLAVTLGVQSLLMACALAETEAVAATMQPARTAWVLRRFIITLLAVRTR
jgi:hypothetical protein